VAGDADRLTRRGHEISIGVGEDAELEPAAPCLGERVANLREDRPARQRPRQSVPLLDRNLRSMLLCDLPEHEREHLPVAPVVLFHLGLELVVALEQLLARDTRNEALELTPDAGVPVDERAVAVEGREAGHEASAAPRSAENVPSTHSLSSGSRR